MLTFFHPAQLEHRPRTYFSRGQMRTPQEVPDRALRLLDAVKALGFALREPPDAGAGPLGAVHEAGYLRFLEEAHAEWRAVGEDWGEEVMSNIFVAHPNPLRGVLGKAARYLADGSCPVGERTWHAAYWSAQSAVAAAGAVRDGAGRAYALCRPPGHHARAAAAGGFCYLNNAAIAAEILRPKFGRVAVLDTDVHHGQGIQEIFYERADVLYASVHGDPTNFYPATAGFADETGAGAGAGCNANFPVPHGTDEAGFFEHVEAALRAVVAHGPGALVLAFGLDIYEKDPQAKVRVSTGGFARLGARIGALGLPTVVVQEGGYHLETLDANARAFFGGLLGGGVA